MSERSFDEVAIRLHAEDSVAVLKRPVRAGDELLNGTIHLRIAQNIGAGHKIALKEIVAADAVRKYGQVIGFAQARITPGEHVHTHNLVMKDFGRDYQFSADARPVDYHSQEE